MRHLNADPGRGEWPLILFTLGVQAACGASVAALVADITVTSDGVAGGRTPGLLVFPLVVLASLGSAAHLGRPLDAWKAVRNLRVSRLSHEVLVTALFGLAALGCGLLWHTDRAALRAVFGWATSVLGLLAVVCSAWIYAVPARPVWHSWWVSASFVGVVLLATGAAATLSTGQPELGGVAFAFGGLLQAASGVRMMQVALRVARRESLLCGVDRMARVRSTPVCLLLVLHLLMAGLVPALLAGWLAVQGAGIAGRVIPGLCAVVSLIGALLGRRLMFTLGASAPTF